MPVVFTPNMNLPEPIVGQELGPQWATDLNAALTILDQHTHAASSGVQITPAGININVDLPMNNNNLTVIRSLRLNPQPSTLSLPTDLGCLYESGVDLYYNDGNGNQVRITQSGSVAGASGTITGLPSGTASASYGAGTFVFQSATNTPANIDGESFILRNNVVNSKGLTLNPPNAMGANYSLTLPPIPSVKSILTIDTSGNIVGSLVTDNATLTSVSSGTLAVATAGIQTANIANGAVTAAKLAAGILQTHQQFTSSTTFTVPVGVNILVWTLVGGGGGGGGGGPTNGGAKTTGSGGGGGSAGQVITEAVTTTPGEVWTITVGAAGSAGSAGTSFPTQGGAGSAGGQSIALAGTSGMQIIADGGGGGVGGTNNGAVSNNAGSNGATGGTTLLGLFASPGGTGSTGAQGNAPAINVSYQVGAGGGGGSAGYGINNGATGAAGSGASSGSVPGGTANGTQDGTAGGGGGAGGTNYYANGTGGAGGNGGGAGSTTSSPGSNATGFGAGGGGGGGGNQAHVGSAGGNGSAGIIYVFYQAST